MASAGSIFGLAVLTTACSHSANAVQPPASIELAPARAGLETQVRLEIVEGQTYAISVRFLHAGTAEDAVRVAGLVGAGRFDSGRRWVEPGVPATFKLRVLRQPDNEVIVEETVDHPKTRAGGTGPLADLVTTRLEPGQYLVSLDEVAAAPELSTLRRRLVIAKAHHGK